MVQIITKATCKKGVVENADDIFHLTGGKGDSEGIIIVQGGTPIYLPNDIKDKQQTIEELVKLNEQVVELSKDLIKVIMPIANAMVTPIPAQTGLPTGLIAGFTGGADFQASINQIQSRLNQITRDCNDLKGNLV
jgi:hypothetical protein